jgi:hypothetical protein
LLSARTVNRFPREEPLDAVYVGRLYFEWRSVAVRGRAPVDATKEADIFGGQIRR